MKKLFLVLTIFTLVMLPLAAMAITNVPVDPADYFDVRSSNNLSEIFAQNWDTFNVNWGITDMGSYFHYEYTFSGSIDPVQQLKNFSHLLLELSPGVVIGDIKNLTGATPEAINPIFDWTSQQGNPGLPGTLHGIKLNPVAGSNIFTFSFDINRAPVYGNFYAKDGGGTDPATAVIAMNWALQYGDPISFDKFQYIAVPDTTAVPIPGSLLLLGSGLLGLVGLRKKLQ